MTAPVVSPGGASPPRVTDARGAGRKEETAQADGTFAALLAALAPAAPTPGEGAAPAAGAPGVPAPGGDALGLLSALTGQPQAGLPAQPAADALSGVAAGEAGSQAGAAGPVPFPAGMVLPEQGEPAPVVADSANPFPAAAPGGEGGAEAATGPGAAAALVPEGAAGPEVTQPAQVRVDLPGGPEAAAKPDAPAPQATGAEGVHVPVVEALPEPAAEPAGREGAGLGEGGTDQPPEFRAGAAEGQAATDGAAAPDAAPGPAVDAAAGPAGGAPPAAEASQARGLERLTAGRLQAQQVVEELSRALPELQDGTYRLTLRLRPEHLGEVRLELHLSGREVHAAMEVANVDARQALESRGDQLRQSLSDAGYNLAGFEVATGQGRQPRRGQEEEPAGWAQPSGRSVRPAEGPAAAAIHRIRSPGARGGRLDTMA